MKIIVHGLMTMKVIVLLESLNETKEWVKGPGRPVGGPHGG